MMQQERQMRIVTVELSANSRPEPIDIEILLRRLASCPEPLIAAQWQKLLSLVEALRTDGPHPTVQAQVLGSELYLWPSISSKVVVRIRVDWQDFAPLQGGLPAMHYRLQIQRRGATLSKDARTERAEEVEGIIREAFGWAR
jgi:hypothetical protein